MREEQTPHFEVVEHPWYGDEAAALQEVVGGVSLGTDFPLDQPVSPSTQSILLAV
jgi:hypothetical protein